MNIVRIILITLIAFGCTKEVKNNQTSTTGTKIHTLKYIAESPVKTFVRYQNKNNARVSENFTGYWEYEAQIESPFSPDLYISPYNSGDIKFTGKILIDGKIVTEGTSTTGSLSCDYVVY